MRKLLIIITVFLATTLIAACETGGTTGVPLPDIRFLDKDGIEQELLNRDLAPNFFVDETTEMSAPYLFIEYMGEYEIGDVVEEGSTIPIVVSSSLEEEYYEPASRTPIDVEGHFTAASDVALYLDTFGTLPDNFITTEDALALGYDEDLENLWDVAEDKSLGGDPFDASERDALPDDTSRNFFTADLNYEGGERSDARLVYSDDGLIYVTEDLYETFEQLFGTKEHPPLAYDEPYTDLEDVALYVRTFGELPSNYYDRDKVQNEWGWQLDRLKEEKGDDAMFGYWHFSNFAGQLPENGRGYEIADIHVFSHFDRGNERIVFSNDGLVYYTPDHFDTYEMLYGDGREE